MKSVGLIGGLVALAAAENGSALTKVIQLLKDIKGKAASELKNEAAQYSEFAQFCDDEAATRQNSIKEASGEIEDLTALIQSCDAKIATSADAIQASSAQSAANEEELGRGKKQRAEEKEVNTAAQAELGETVNMLARAKTVLERSLSFAQGGKVDPAYMSKMVDAIRVVIDASSTNLDNKRKLEAFLQDTDSDDLSLMQQPQAKQVAYESKSGSIVSTIEDMRDEAEEQLQEERKKEMEQAHTWAMMEQNLTTQNKHLDERVKEAQNVSQTASSDKGQAQKDLQQQQDNKATDEAYLKDLVSSCRSKATEWDARQKSAAAEQKALGEAIGILSQKFSFVELKTVTKHMALSEKAQEARSKAGRVLKKLGRKFNSFAMMEVAAGVVRGDVFEKIRGLITGMINKLQKQAQEEATQHAFCQEETKKSNASRKDKEQKIEKHQTRLDKIESGRAKLNEQIQALQQELNDMQQSQAKATKLRHEEAAAFAAQEKDLSESQVAVESALGVLREHYGASGAALLQQPEGPSFGANQGDAASMILGILEQAAEEFSVNLAQAKASEQESVANFEKMVQANAVSKASKEASLKGKEAEVKSLAEMFQTVTSDKESVTAELDAVLEYIEKLKPQCTRKVETYEERKAKREAEVSGLKDALEILSAEGGEGEAFVQKQAFLQRKK